MTTLTKSIVALSLATGAFAQTPAILRAVGQPLKIPNMRAHGMSIDTKAAENGILVQVSFVWYSATLDGSAPMRFDPQAKGVDLQPMDMAYDGRDRYFMVGAVEDPNRKTQTAYLETFDRHANAVSLHKIERNDPVNVTFWPRKIAAFGNGLILISGTTMAAGSKADKLDTAIYNDQGQWVKTLELRDDVIPNPQMPPGDDGTATLARDYTLMDEASQAKFRSNKVLSAEIAAVTSFVDRTADGNVLIVRKGAYVLNPVAFRIKPTGEVSSFRVPSLHAAESVSCRFENGHLAMFYEQTVDASQPPKGIMLVMNTNGKTVNDYECSAPGMGMLLAGWDGRNTFTFITTMGDIKDPHVGFITLTD